MRNTNEMELIFDSLSANEGFARVAVAAFMTQLNPTVEDEINGLYTYDRKVCKADKEKMSALAKRLQEAVKC